MDFAKASTKPEDMQEAAYELLEPLLGYEGAMKILVPVMMALTARDVRASLIAREHGAHNIANIIMGYEIQLPPPPEQDQKQVDDER